MAGGSLDPNGVWLYGEDDARDTFSELLNIGQDSTSDAIGVDRGRLATLETANTLGPVNSAVFTEAAGWGIEAQQARRKNGVVIWRLRFTRFGAAITVSPNGEIPNTLVATIAAAWLPAGGMPYPAAAADVGPIVAGSVYDQSGWGVYITAVAPGVTIPTGGAVPMSLTGIYPLA